MTRTWRCHDCVQVLVTGFMCEMVMSDVLCDLLQPFIAEDKALV